jgi:hypothetical protein
VVRAVARTVSARGFRLSAEETAKVLRLGGLGGSGFLNGTVRGKIGSRLELSGGLRVERSARELRFWRQGRDYPGGSPDLG